jgi:DNA processing protein
MNDRIARAALTRLFEPHDTLGRTLVGRLGAYAALRLATSAQPAHTLPGRDRRGTGRRIEALGTPGP